MSIITNNGIEKVTVSAVKIDSRLRAIDDTQVQFIAESFEQIGQQTAITCSREQDGTLVLVAGAHRLAAATLLEWTEIDATVYENLDSDSARLIEIDENLCRRELNPLDRAVFMGERKAVYEKLHPESANGGDRVSGEYQNDSVSFCSFSDATADAVGINKRTIERAVRIYSRISPELRSRISGTWLAGKMGELYALTNSEPAEQEKIVDLLFDDESDIGSVKAAVQKIRGHKAPSNDPDSVDYRKLVTLFTRAPADTKHQFASFVEQYMIGGEA